VELVVIVAVALALAPVESVTAIVTVPADAGAIKTPVLELIEAPVTEELEIENVYGELPPLAVNVVCAFTATLIVLGEIMILPPKSRGAVGVVVVVIGVVLTVDPAVVPVELLPQPLNIKKALSSKNSSDVFGRFIKIPLSPYQSQVSGHFAE
jgi:hypothetical protein